MKNKLLVLTLTLLLLTGCSLANPAMGQATLPAQAGDPMVGVVITREHLDLWDPTEGHQKLYATPDESGRPSFALPDSIAYFTYEYDSPVGRTTAIVNDGVWGAGPHIKDSDEGQSVELAGTLYVPASSGTVCFYFNPVYQATDDSLYLTAGQGTALSGEHGEGMSFSHKMTDSVTRTENGKSQNRSCSVDVTAEVVAVPKEIRLLQMDSAGTLLHSQSWAPGSVPEQLELHKDCAWVVLEQIKEAGTGRMLYNSGDQYAESFYPADGLVKVRTTTLVWP